MSKELNVCEKCQIESTSDWNPLSREQSRRTQAVPTQTLPMSRCQCVSAMALVFSGVASVLSNLPVRAAFSAYLFSLHITISMPCSMLPLHMACPTSSKRSLPSSHSPVTYGRTGWQALTSLRSNLELFIYPHLKTNKQNYSLCWQMLPFSIFILLRCSQSPPWWLYLYVVSLSPVLCLCPCLPLD